MPEFETILNYLKELAEDNTISKNIKIKLKTISDIIEKEDDTNIKINRALDELENITSNTNIQAFTRTQIWNLISMLENI